MYNQIIHIVSVTSFKTAHGSLQWPVIQVLPLSFFLHTKYHSTQHISKFSHTSVCFHLYAFWSCKLRDFQKIVLKPPMCPFQVHIYIAFKEKYSSLITPMSYTTYKTNLALWAYFLFVYTEWEFKVHFSCFSFLNEV